MEPIDQFRQNPEATLRVYGFTITESLPRSQRNCSITTAPAVLESHPGPMMMQKIRIHETPGPDYFLEYRHSLATSVDVPRDAKVQALVLTPDMNGCALEIWRIGTDLRFFHDSDGNSMPPLPPGATRVARYTSALYMGNEQADSIFQQALAFGKKEGLLTKGGYGHTILSLKEATHWTVWCSTWINVCQYTQDGDLERGYYKPLDVGTHFLGAFSH